MSFDGMSTRRCPCRGVGDGRDVIAGAQPSDSGSEMSPASSSMYFFLCSGTPNFQQFDSALSGSVSVVADHHSHTVYGRRQPNETETCRASISTSSIALTSAASTTRAVNIPLHIRFASYQITGIRKPRLTQGAADT